MVKAFKKGSLYWIIQVNQTAVICVLIEGQGESWYSGSVKAKQMADDTTGRGASWDASRQPMIGGRQ